MTGDTETVVAGRQLIEQAAGRVETLLAASSSGGTAARDRAEELVRVLVELYGAGLERLLDLLHERGLLDEGLLGALAGDELVSGLLLVHGLHPHDPVTRITGALDRLRPQFDQAGGELQLVEFTAQGVARVRLGGGCASSAAARRSAIEGAVRDAAPEVTGVELLTAPRASGVIPLGDLRRRTVHSSTGTA
ncbi:MAG TPA: NifU family protein [Jatrophihabitans sp.]|nr:NifU family protein [Jatrophihabitans sp.]